MICPVGPVDQEILEHIRCALFTRFDFICRFHPTLPVPDDAYNETRCQYNSKTIIQQLLRCCPPNTLRFLAVTRVDLYVPILKYVYGLAQIDGRCLLVSLHRLCPRFYDQPPNFALLLERSEKTVLHELGHTFGLTHCRDRRCVMYSSTRIEDTDSKDIEYCSTCYEMIRWRIEKIGR